MPKKTNKHALYTGAHLSCMLVDTLITTNKAYMATAFDTAISPIDEINSGTNKRDGIHSLFIDGRKSTFSSKNLHVFL